MFGNRWLCHLDVIRNIFNVKSLKKDYIGCSCVTMILAIKSIASLGERYSILYIQMYKGRMYRMYMY